MAEKLGKGDAPLRGKAGLLPALGFLLVVIVLSTLWLLFSARETTGEAVCDLSEIYLEELSRQRADHFTDTLEGLLRQLSTTVHALRTADAASEADLRAFIRQMKELNDYEFFALVDEGGTVYMEKGALSDGALPDFLSGEFREPVVSFDQRLGGRNLVLVSMPVEGQSLEGQRLIAAAVGISADTVSDRLSLSDEEGRSFNNVVMSDGSYVVQTRHTHIAPDDNLFSALARDAVFQEEGALDRWREDLEDGRSGMVAYSLENILHYTYYMPIRGTGWFIMTTIHYDFISENVDIIRTTLTRNAIVQLALVLAVLLLLFAVYLFMRRRNDGLRFEKLQAEESSKAKSRFLSNMSHDIRTPMNAIIGFTNLAMQNTGDPERTRGYLTKILSSSNHLLALINDVLEMSRIESGKIQLEETACGLPDLLHELSNIILEQARGKGLVFLVEAADVTDENVLCDRLRLSQVFLNLLGNAVKFTPSGGEVVLRLEQVPGAPAGYGDYVVQVRDTGIGMTEAFAKRVFEPFERERTSTVSGIQGTGLGMTITKNILDLMGGTIELTTAPGKGTTFTIHLRLRLQEDQPSPARPPLPEGARALVADGDPEACTALVRMLGRLGIEAAWTTSGEEAVRLAGREHWDVCVVNRRLSDLDGVETVRRIRAVAGEGPLVLLTAYDWTAVEAEARAAGVSGFCCKPVFLSELQRALSQAAGRQSAPAAPEPEEPAAPDFSGRRILLVEDNELNREIMVEVLTAAGLAVEEAEDGTVAVEKVREAASGYYDLILMDIQMPVLDGYGATKAIRALENQGLASIPIIAMTANAFEEDRQAALASGMNDHLAKPLDVGRLFSLLEALFR